MSDCSCPPKIHVVTGPGGGGGVPTTPAECQQTFQCIIDNGTATQYTQFINNVDWTTLTAEHCQEIFACIIANGTSEQFTEFINTVDWTTLTAEHCREIFQCIIDGGTEAQITELFQRFDFTDLTATQCQAIFDCLNTNGTTEQYTTFVNNIDWTTLSPANCAIIAECVAETIEFCAPLAPAATGPLVNPGTVSEQVAVYTPLTDGDYTFTIAGVNVVGTAGLQVGSTPGASDVYQTPLADRATPATPSVTNTVALVAGTTYYISGFAGGGASTADSLTISAVCPDGLLEVPAGAISGPLFTVNAGAAGDSGDAANGAVGVNVGDIVHFQSDDGSVTINVTPGSAIVDLSVAAPTTDTAGSVLTATAALTTTNGVAVAIGEPYTLFPDGTTWAAPAGTTDTSGTVETATAAVTTTNGVAVPIGGQYLLLPDGTTWATQAGAGDTFAVLTTATAEITTTNGVVVPIGGQYLTLAGGDTWANAPAAIANLISSEIGNTLRLGDDNRLYADPSMKPACYNVLGVYPQQPTRNVGPAASNDFSHIALADYSLTGFIGYWDSNLVADDLIVTNVTTGESVNLGPINTTFTGLSTSFELPIPLAVSTGDLLTFVWDNQTVGNRIRWSLSGAGHIFIGLTGASGDPANEPALSIGLEFITETHQVYTSTDGEDSKLYEFDDNGDPQELASIPADWVLCPVFNTAEQLAIRELAEDVACASPIDMIGVTDGGATLGSVDYHYENPGDGTITPQGQVATQSQVETFILNNLGSLDNATPTLQVGLDVADQTTVGETDLAWIEFWALVPEGGAVVSWESTFFGSGLLAIGECGADFETVDFSSSATVGVTQTVSATLPAGLHLVRMVAIDHEGNLAEWTYSGDAIQVYAPSTGTPEASAQRLWIDCDGDLFTDQAAATPFAGSAINPTEYACPIDPAPTTKCVDCWIDNAGVDQINFDEGGAVFSDAAPVRLNWSSGDAGSGLVTVRLNEAANPFELNQPVRLVITQVSNGAVVMDSTAPMPGAGVWDVDFGLFTWLDFEAYTFDLTTPATNMLVLSAFQPDPDRPVTFDVPVPAGPSSSNPGAPTHPSIRFVSATGEPIQVITDTDGEQVACDSNGDTIDVPDLDGYVKCTDTLTPTQAKIVDAVTEAGTVEETAAAALVTTNGVPVPIGGSYVRFPDGSTWATDLTCEVKTPIDAASGTLPDGTTWTAAADGSELFFPSGDIQWTNSSLLTINFSAPVDVLFEPTDTNLGQVWHTGGATSEITTDGDDLIFDEGTAAADITVVGQTATGGPLAGGPQSNVPWGTLLAQNATTVTMRANVQDGMKVTVRQYEDICATLASLEDFNTPSVLCKAEEFALGAGGIAAGEPSTPLQGFLMYTEQAAQARFGAAAAQEPNLVGVFYDAVGLNGQPAGTWYYSENNIDGNVIPGWPTFTPQPTDFLIADVSFANGPAGGSVFNGPLAAGSTGGVPHAINLAGLDSIEGNKYTNGTGNTGEFYAAGVLGNINNLSKARLQLDGTYVLESDGSVISVTDAIAQGWAPCLDDQNGVFAATVPFTTTNGASLLAGDTYILLPNGDTFADVDVDDDNWTRTQLSGGNDQTLDPAGITDKVWRDQNNGDQTHTLLNGDRGARIIIGKLNDTTGTTTWLASFNDGNNNGTQLTTTAGEYYTLVATPNGQWDVTGHYPDTVQAAANGVSIDNADLTAYTDRPAAVAAITVLLGFAAGKTHLYFNSTTGAIEGVRL